MKELAVNTFKGGLVMDLNPMAGDGTTLSNALNATLITNNGNELMLLNDMGNGRINKVRLDEGYIPVGIKEHGGIIYIASYNPENKKGQIGSFPYPKVEWDNNDFVDRNPDPDMEDNRRLSFIYGDNIINSTSSCDNLTVTFTEIINNSLKVKLFIIVDDQGEKVQAKFKQGDYFTLTFDSTTSKYLKADNIEASIVSKTASDYVTLYTISKEELSEEGTTISATYDYPYSGTLFLLISLNIPDTFDVSYTYNNGKFTVYPYAYNSKNPENMNATTNIVDATLKDSNIHVNNFNCSNSITLEAGIYELYPVTSDKGYLNYLKQRVYLDTDLNHPNHIFKYTFNNELLDLYWDIYTNKPEYLGGVDTSYRFTYNFYDLETASSVKSLSSLLLLAPVLQIIKEGYAAVSGVRNLKCSLPADTIYVLLITVAKKSLDTYSEDTPCFSGFVYGTPRYNDFFKPEDNFNNIEEDSHSIRYSFNRQLLELNRTEFTNRHYLLNPDTLENYWEKVQGIVLFSDSPIAPSAFPIAYSTEIGVTMTKTEEPVVIAPSLNINFIYDSDQFSIESSKFNVNLKKDEVEIIDIPAKNENTRIITSLDNNAYKGIEKEEDHITFYRYISSESSDGQAQLTRTFKLLMPIFNPNMSNYEEVFGFDHTDSAVTAVLGSKKYLNKTNSSILSVGMDIRGEATRVGESEGNASPGVIKLFLLLHSKEYRGLDVSSIFDLFGGGVKENGTRDEGSLRIEDTKYIPIRKYSGLDYEGEWDEFDHLCRFLIPSCLTYTKLPLLLPLPSNTIGLFYNRDYQENYVDNRSKYPINDCWSADVLDSREHDLLIPAFKKLFCLLSQIFTLQTQEAYTYVVGPSEVTVNYNIQDDSYVKYIVSLQNQDIFIDDNILINLNDVRKYLEEDNNLIVLPRNYIGRLKLQELLDSYFFYGREVNMDSDLYNNVLSQYITAYDEAVVIDNSSGYSPNDIYYLNALKIYRKHPSENDIKQFDYTGAHNRIINNEDYPLDDGYDGAQVIDGDYNQIWGDLDIYYNPAYNCYLYDLSKENYLRMLTKSVNNSLNCILDWAGNCWEIPALINSFMTIEEAKTTPGSVLDTYSNNYIVLRNLNTVSSTWTKGSDTSGPNFAKVNLGFRGCYKKYETPRVVIDERPYSTLRFFKAINGKIKEIVNLYNHNKVAINGGYKAPEVFPDDPEPEPEPETT